MYFDVFQRHLKIHNVWTMFDRFFLHFTFFVILLLLFTKLFSLNINRTLILKKLYLILEKDFFQKSSYFCKEFLKIYGFFQNGRKKAIF